MIRGNFFWIAFLGLAGVYLVGLFARLMENDSAQFAVMAMRMVQEQDFLNLWKGGEEYLDKPHLHYWLAAFSYSLFGVYDWAYRVPALLATFLGAYSSYGLGSALYNRNTGRISALIFMSAQTIILSVIDVRTDAVLTGFAVFAIWQLYSYLKEGALTPLIMGAAGAGLAFSTKGQIALLVIGLPLLCQLIYTRSWHRLWSPKILLGLLTFALVISPVLYAYYHQFDLHPEKIIRGKNERSGVFFILWEQSFERLSGEGVGKNSSDYFFFFHTFLWVFLPWTLLGLWALWGRIRVAFEKDNTKNNPEKGEILTTGGIASIFLIISFAQFKLPHYLNITIPLFAVLTASFLDRLYREGALQKLRRAGGVQLGIYTLVCVAVSGITLWVFPLGSFPGYLLLTGGVVLGYFLFFKWADPMVRLIGISLYGSVLLNLVLNGHFYPSLLEYQGGSAMADRIEAESLEPNTLYKLSDEHTWALDFYFGKPLEIVRISDLTEASETIWLYADTKELEKLGEAGVLWDTEFTVDQFRISRLQGRFLNPKTRSEVLRKRHLVRIPGQKP
ncbi:MAG: glycosyltransferase family 39 protein [Robiginitalea sp.]|uniref:ArnT family glycosyltransferase n=1 Tax=Robiginitalea sp. TaxID=1902411 RepID=UPI003C76747A